MNLNFSKLFEPGMIGNMKVKNRIVKAPQHTGLCNPDGSVTERLLRYYKEVALGGAGLIIVEYSWIDYDASRASPCQIGVADINHIPGLSLLAQTIQANGAKAALTDSPLWQPQTDSYASDKSSIQSSVGGTPSDSGLSCTRRTDF